MSRRHCLILSTKWRRYCIFTKLINTLQHLVDKARKDKHQKLSTNLLYKYNHNWNTCHSVGIPPTLPIQPTGALGRQKILLMSS